MRITLIFKSMSYLNSLPNFMTIAFLYYCLSISFHRGKKKKLIIINNKIIYRCYLFKYI